MQEATARSFFPSWEAINWKHREVVKFTCGLMPDPRPLVDHVYTMLIEHVLEEMRSRPIICPDIYRESLYQESAVALPGSALHNQHINYYHWWDEYEKRPRDTTPVFTPSKLYIFNEIEEDVALEHRTFKTVVTRDPCQSDTNRDPPKCAFWIRDPDKRLLSLCETISESQPVTDFIFNANETRVRMNRNPGLSERNNFNSQKCSITIETDKSQVDRMLSLCKTLSTSQPVTYFRLTSNLKRIELTEANVPVMSKEATLLRLETVDVSSVWKYLLQHESLEDLCLLWIHLPDAAVPLIFNHRNLKALSLHEANMSHEMCEYVCHHLGDLVHLEEINLSKNDLSHVSSIRLRNTTSPVTLNLRSKNMSPELLKSICQLTSVVKLKELDLLGNTLTAQLHHPVSEPPQSLEALNLDYTKLNKNDIGALTRAVQKHVLPELKKMELGLGSNNLNRMERERWKS